MKNSMEYRKKLLSAVLLATVLMMPTEAFGINKLTKIYLFGFATSFTDSTVYVTDIQEIDSAWIDSRTKFLYGRQDFSYQFAQHLRSDENPHPTAIVVFAEKRKNIEKKFLKLRKRYTNPKKGVFTIKTIDSNTFHFSAVIPDSPEVTYSKDQLKAAIKEEKAAIKQKLKEKKIAEKKEKIAKKEAKKKAMNEAKQRAKELKDSKQ